MVNVDTTYHCSLLEHLSVPLYLLVDAPRRLSVLDELRSCHGAGVVAELDLFIAVFVALLQPGVELSSDVRTLLLQQTQLKIHTRINVTVRHRDGRQHIINITFLFLHEIIEFISLSSSFPFVRGEVLPANFPPPHLLVFSTLLCLLSSLDVLPPLLPSSHLS